ncbi:hypothetical protein EMCRGX_G007724 [Ephydatia muelleri]
MSDGDSDGDLDSLLATSQVRDLSCGLQLCHKCKRPARAVRYFRLRTGEDELESDPQVDQMKQRLKFHFMNPFQKWSYAPKRRFPWKMLLQIVNMILVVVQVVVFASSKYVLMDFVTLNKQTFVQLFIFKPSVDYSVFEPDSGPPVSTIFTFDELFQQLNYTSQRYHALGKMAVAPFGQGWDDSGTHSSTTPRQVNLEVTRYAYGNIDSSGRNFSIHGERVTDKYRLGDTSKYGLNYFVNTTALKAEFSRVLDLKMSFAVSTVYLEGNSPDCILFNIKIIITNDFHRGNMPVRLAVDTDISLCNSDTAVAEPDTGFYVNAGITALDCLVLLSSSLSTLVCVRSLIRTFYFQKKLRCFFKQKYNYGLKWKDSLPLFNMWFVGVLISSALAIIGSLMKVILSYQPNLSTINLSDLTSIVVGLATFGQILGCLRFLSYLESYNILLITMRVALPSVLRFVVCAGVLYIAFVLTGWLVLGPYHSKFRNIMVTSESLFSLINGDDMFTAFDGMSRASLVAYLFSKVYLYVFVSMFIYVVLSVFISLIKDTYETLHEQWTVRSRGFLQDFVNGGLHLQATSSSDDELIDVSSQTHGERTSTTSNMAVTSF